MVAAILGRTDVDDIAVEEPAIDEGVAAVHTRGLAPRAASEGAGA